MSTRTVRMAWKVTLGTMEVIHNIQTCVGLGIHTNMYNIELYNRILTTCIEMLIAKSMGCKSNIFNDMCYRITSTPAVNIRSLSLYTSVY